MNSVFIVIIALCVVALAGLGLAVVNALSESAWGTFTIAMTIPIALVVGVFVVQPELKMPAFTSFIHGGGPVIPGKVFPFLFITIACGAISGFHSLVASGTTPKMISKESDTRLNGRTLASSGGKFIPPDFGQA